MKEKKNKINKEQHFKIINGIFVILLSEGYLKINGMMISVMYFY